MSTSTPWTGASSARSRRSPACARDIVALTDYLRAEGLPYAFNHPFWHEPDETPDLRAVIDIARLFPVLEYNMGRIGRINAQAFRLARTLGKGVTAGTDSHVGEIARAFTLARGDSFGEFFGNIAARRSHLCPADLTLPRLKAETSLLGFGPSSTKPAGSTPRIP